MSCWHSNHKWIAPDRDSNNAISDFVGLCKPHIVQIVVQPFDLL